MKIRVNGRNVSVSAEESLLTGLLQNGFMVPNLCYLKELEPYGGCGLCLVEINGMLKSVRACSVMPTEGMEVQTESPRIIQSRKITLGLLLSDHRGDCLAPCVLACPANQDCQGYIGLIANGQFDAAFARIMEDNPLPGCIGRVCPHPCEEACRRNLLEGPLSIMRLKRFAADTVWADERSQNEKGMGKSEEIVSAAYESSCEKNTEEAEAITSVYQPNIGNRTGKTVAVIGAGPSGLSAAYFLAKYGHKAVVFDQMEAAGGMLRYGIPAYRLSDEVVDQEVKRIESMGVTFQYNKKLGVDIHLPVLRAEYDAVYIAVGAWESTALGCENDDLPGVLGGIDFLRDVALGKPPAIGKRLAVVGGGNTAMDVARTAVRLGAEKVHLLYRRTRAEMPADKLEIDEAEEEGVLFQFLAAPEAVVEKDNRAAGLRLQMMRLGEPDASGRRRPEATGESKDEAFDTIIAAIGQKVSPDGLDDIEKHRWRTIRANEETFETNLPGVFAGGDAVNDGPGIAITAIAHGKKAAQAIDGYLRGSLPHGEKAAKAVNGTQYGILTPVSNPFYVLQKDITKDDLPCVPEIERAAYAAEPPEKRVTHFDEYVKPLGKREAIREASRCLECGCCDFEDCRLLPLLQKYDAQDTELSGLMPKKERDDSHPAVWRDENKCILCGLCVRICGELVGAAALGFDRRGFETGARPAFDQPLKQSECISCGHCADVCPTGALQARLPFAKSPALPANIEEMVCERCESRCRFDLYRYGDFVLNAVPQEINQCCSIGRYGPLIESMPGREWTAREAEALYHVIAGDLAAYRGDFPVNIGPFVIGVSNFSTVPQKEEK